MCVQSKRFKIVKKNFTPLISTSLLTLTKSWHLTHCIPYSTSVAVRYLLAFLWLGQIAKASRKSLMAALSLSWFAQLRINNKSLKYWMLKLSSNTLIEATTAHIISLVLWWLVFVLARRWEQSPINDLSFFPGSFYKLNVTRGSTWLIFIYFFT